MPYNIYFQMRCQKLCQNNLTVGIAGSKVVFSGNIVLQDVHAKLLELNEHGPAIISAKQVEPTAGGYFSESLLMETWPVSRSDDLKFVLRWPTFPPRPEMRTSTGLPSSWCRARMTRYGDGFRKQVLLIKQRLAAFIPRPSSSNVLVSY